MDNFSWVVWGINFGTTLAVVFVAYKLNRRAKKKDDRLAQEREELKEIRAQVREMKRRSAELKREGEQREANRRIDSTPFLSIKRKARGGGKAVLELEFWHATARDYTNVATDIDSIIFPAETNGIDPDGVIAFRVMGTPDDPRAMNWERFIEYSDSSREFRFRVRISCGNGYAETSIPEWINEPTARLVNL